MRKVIVKLEMKLYMTVDEGLEISEVVNELDYNFTDTTGHADITDMTYEDYEVIDSK